VAQHAGERGPAQLRIGARANPLSSSANADDPAIARSSEGHRFRLNRADTGYWMPLFRGA
jgi:hypothetical protein